MIPHPDFVPASLRVGVQQVSGVKYPRRRPIAFAIGCVRRGTRRGGPTCTKCSESEGASSDGGTRRSGGFFQGNYDGPN